MESDSPIKGVVFDIGATLVTGPPVAPNKVIAGLMDGVTPADVSSIIMTRKFEGPEEVCAALEARYGALSKEATTGIVELWDSQASAPREIPGAQEAVLALKARGLKIGFLSDIWCPYYAGVEKVLPEAIAAADAIVLSFNSGSRKPEPGNFIWVLKRMRVTSSQAVMVGDTYTHDIRPALGIGMKAIWVLARQDREAESVDGVQKGELPDPTATVKDIREVPALDIWDSVSTDTTD